ncbi:predicted protein [Naegleria gruberi]|uniref:dual-specificity kinase n=1 Tax=Naegleria gruberi TaxID=5762 RepID=D2VZA1_NAEGR|nr:uncharacterized protein NAEGRDRAFT_81801 [Naegleria gruberi]EFC37810.1 predicted protein [Naegleria gruberi]|eukprot:XP_002670554.1 predicted protein [Naegleria gruberi strain NEG-M]
MARTSSPSSTFAILPPTSVFGTNSQSTIYNNNMIINNPNSSSFQQNYQQFPSQFYHHIPPSHQQQHQYSNNGGSNLLLSNSNVLTTAPNNNNYITPHSMNNSNNISNNLNSIPLVNTSNIQYDKSIPSTYQQHSIVNNSIPNHDGLIIPSQLQNVPPYSNSQVSVSLYSDLASSTYQQPNTPNIYQHRNSNNNNRDIVTSILTLSDVEQSIPSSKYYQQPQNNRSSTHQSLFYSNFTNGGSINNLNSQNSIPSGSSNADVIMRNSNSSNGGLIMNQTPNIQNNSYSSNTNKILLKPKVINQRSDAHYQKVLATPTSTLIDNTLSQKRKESNTIKLSVNVLKTYKTINDIYYTRKQEERRLRHLKNGKSSQSTPSSKQRKTYSSSQYVDPQKNGYPSQTLPNIGSTQLTTSLYQSNPYPEVANNPNYQQDIPSQQQYSQPLMYSSSNFSNNPVQLYNYQPTNTYNPPQYNNNSLMHSQILQPPPPYTQQEQYPKNQVPNIASNNSNNQNFYQQPINVPQPSVSQSSSDSQGNYIVKLSELINERYLVEEIMGKGSFGIVVKAYDCVNDESVAVKIIKNKPQFHSQAQIEIGLLKDLNSKDTDGKNNIVRMKHYFAWKNHLCIVFELLSMNLYDLLKATNFNGISLLRIYRFGKELLRTLCFLSRPDVQVIHCDLKPENILLKNSKKTSIKVIDFGSSCYVNNKMYKYIQSRFYRSPEVILGLPYGTEIDMWSYGCILVELHTGNPLFDGKNEADQIFKIIQLLGMPPRKMIEQSPKKDKFFKFNSSIGQYEPLDSTIVPSSISLYDIIINISPKRHVSPYSCPFETFENYLKLYNVVTKILHYDPQQRLKPAETLQEEFFKINEVAHNVMQVQGSANQSNFASSSTVPTLNGGPQSFSNPFMYVSQVNLPVQNNGGFSIQPINGGGYNPSGYAPSLPTQTPSSSSAHQFLPTPQSMYRTSGNSSMIPLTSSMMSTNSSSIMNNGYVITNGNNNSGVLINHNNNSNNNMATDYQL